MIEEIDKGSAAHEFIECLVFDRDKSVVMFGEMADADDVPREAVVNKIGTWHKPWFFKHVEAFADNRVTEAVEYIPLRDYYHRHSRWV